MLDRARSPLPFLAGLLALYLLAPIVAFAVRLGGGVSSTPGLGAALLTSLATATVSAAAIAVLGIPLAYLLAHARGAAARLALALVSLPLALPPLMSGLLLLYVVGPYTAAGRLFGGQLTETRIGIVLAQTFVAAPFLIVTARAAFAAVDPALEDVARTLGHGRLARFRRVAVPAALRGIAAGLLLAWLRSFAEFGATVVLAYHPYSLPVFAFVQFDAAGLPATELPVAIALAVALVVLLAGGLRLPSRRRGRRRRRRRAPAPLPLPLAPLPPAPSASAAARGRAGEAPALDFALRKRLGSYSLELAHRASSPHLALLGPSGAGKTLTLRLLAGLMPGEGGHVRDGALDLHALACERRRIGYVPQQSALLPRRTVWSQVTFAARARPELAARWLARLGLAGLEDRYPHELSGGQQRRVALARALASDPRLLLLDEPFTGLDAPVRDRLRRDLRTLQREGRMGTVIVTHDPEEAAMLADEILVIDAGRALQSGPRSEVFRAPRSPRVAALLGIANAHLARVSGPETLRSDGIEVRVPAHGLAAGSEVVWCVRPERIAVGADAGAERADGGAEGADDGGKGTDDGGEGEGAGAGGGYAERRGEGAGYAATLVDEVDLGHARELTAALGELRLTVRVGAVAEPFAAGSRLRLWISPRDVSVWPAREGAAGMGATGMGATGVGATGAGPAGAQPPM